jgi:hypothetical protein
MSNLNIFDFGALGFLVCLVVLFLSPPTIYFLDLFLKIVLVFGVWTMAYISSRKDALESLNEQGEGK